MKTKTYSFPTHRLKTTTKKRHQYHQQNQFSILWLRLQRPIHPDGLTHHRYKSPQLSAMCFRSQSRLLVGTDQIPHIESAHKTKEKTSPFGIG